MYITKDIQVSTFTVGFWVIIVFSPKSTRLTGMIKVCGRCFDIFHRQSIYKEKQKKKAICVVFYIVSKYFCLG